MATAAQTPWSLDKYGGVVDANGKSVAANGFSAIMSPGSRQDNARATAALIVDAVNSHAAHDARVTELLASNNALLERARRAERELAGMSPMHERMP